MYVCGGWTWKTSHQSREVPHHTILHDTANNNTAQQRIVQHSTAKQSTTQHITSHHNTTKHSTTQQLCPVAAHVLGTQKLTSSVVVSGGPIQAQVERRRQNVPVQPPPVSALAVPARRQIRVLSAQIDTCRGHEMNGMCQR